MRPRGPDLVPNLCVTHLYGSLNRRRDWVAPISEGAWHRDSSEASPAGGLPVPHEWHDVRGDQSVSDRIARRAHLLSNVLATFTPYNPGEFPSWWTKALEANIAGELCGAYELVKGAGDGAILVTNKALGIVSNTSVLWIPYDDIVGWEPPKKTPPADSLVLHTSEGDRTTKLRSGDAVHFISFLLSIGRIGKASS